MLKLSLADRPTVLADLVEGVDFQVRPITTADVMLARRAVSGLGPEATQDEISVAFSIALAKRVVVGWSGVGDPAGKIIPPTPENIEALLTQSYAVFIAFDARYVVPSLTGADEKNGSRASSNGTSTAARPTAKRVSKPVAKAVKTAPISPASRRRPKASSFGK